MTNASNLLPEDTLRTGYPKINQGIDNANEALKKSLQAETTSNNAVYTSNNAVNTASAAEVKANSVQEQFNQVVIKGDSSVEAAQARVNQGGTPYQTLKERLDTEFQINNSQVVLLNDAVVNAETYKIKIPESDDTARVQRALNSFATKSGTLFFPKLEYIINDELLVNYSCRIMMDKGGSFKVKNNSYLHSKGAKTSIFVINADNVIIEDLHINGNAQNNFTIGSDGKKYYLSLPSMNPGVYLGYNGIQIKGSNVIVSNCFIEWCSWGGILVDTEDDNIISKNIKLLNNRIEYCPEDDISLHRCTEVDVIGNIIRDPMHHAIHAYYKCSYVNILGNTITLTKANCFEFYPNALNLEAFGGIGIDHAAYQESEISNIIVANNKVRGELAMGVEVMGFAKNVLVTDNQFSITGYGVLLDSPVVGLCKISTNQFIDCKTPVFLNWDANINAKPTYSYEDFSSLVIENNQFKGSTSSHIAFYMNDRGNIPFTKMYIKVKNNNFKKGTSQLAYAIRFDSYPAYLVYSVDGNDFTDGYNSSAFIAPSGFTNADVNRFCFGNIGINKNDVMTQTSNPYGRQSVFSGNTGVTVTLSGALTQLDTNYTPLITPEWKSGSIWISNKTSTSFSVNWDTPPTANANIGFLLVR